MLKKEENFDFTILEKKSTINSQNNVENTEKWDTVLANTVITQMTHVVFYYVMIMLLMKTSNESPALAAFSIIIIWLSQITFVSNAIIQAIIQYRKRNIKNQLINGFMNAGLFIALYPLHGFSTIYQLVNQVVSIF